MRDRNDKGLSRRGFMKTSAAVLSAVAAGALPGIVTAGQMIAGNAMPSNKVKEGMMPHVSVKLWPGRSEEEKKRLAAAITKDVVGIIRCGEESVSVAIEEISAADWKKKVYDPEISGKMDALYKKPGYSM
jgi:4-oxalocrotonate tautomerase